MQITLEGEAKEFVEQMMQAGGHPSADAAVDSLLRHEHAKHTALRAKVQAALAEEGEVGEKELDQYLDAIEQELKQEGLE